MLFDESAIQLMESFVTVTILQTLVREENIEKISIKTNNLFSVRFCAVDKLAARQFLPRYAMRKRSILAVGRCLSVTVRPTRSCNCIQMANDIVKLRSRPGIPVIVVT